jgi:tellurite resistance protein
MASKVVDLTHVAPERLQAAIRALIEGQAAETLTRSGHHLPSTESLREGAAAVHGEGDDPKARHFQSMLELGYLVASADGFADAERNALSTLLEQITGSAVNHEELELHFRDLDDACSVLGRHERLRRAAAEFEDNIGRDEALAFAALVAVADGRLAAPEMSALSELGRCFEIRETEVEVIVDGMVRDIEHAVA